MIFEAQNLPEKGSTVVVGLSGGIDSTMTALFLKEKGCKVIGVTMSVWDGRLPENVNVDSLPDSCYGPSELKSIEECKKFCLENEIDYHVVNVSDLYKKNILEYFTSEYRSGRTPNPCIQCNCKIKFGALLEGIKRLGIDFDYFCTGHYARIVRPEKGIWNTQERPFMIQRASDSTKDQTYFLYRVPSEILEKVRFPLSDIKKSEIFKIAKERNLEAANRSESQDFAPEEYFELFFKDKPSVPGDIINLDGKILGRHKGIEHYTVGQRRGLGVALNYPVYVHSIDAKNNLVILAKNDELNSLSLIADDMVFPKNIVPPKNFEAEVKIRLASKPVKAKIELIQNPKNPESYVGNPYKITFFEPQRAVAPGQSVVIYIDETIAGGGIIKEAQNINNVNI